MKGQYFMQSIEQIKEISVISHLPLPKYKDVSQMSKSEAQKLEEYLQFFNIPLQRSQEDIFQKKESIFQKWQYFQENIGVKVIYQYPKEQFILLSVRVGNITIPRISIANLNYQSHIHKCSNVKFGGFGRIYLCQSLGKRIAVKCIKKQINEQSFTQNFDEVLREYSYQYIAVNFLKAKVGPDLSKQLGYDIAVYSDCIEFAMEACIQLKDLQDDKQNLEKTLKDNLLAMHSQKFFHLDIKPENIMFSPTFKKYIFCDFGFSTLIKQGFGYKTKTLFKGTLANCSAEMRCLYDNQKGEGQVDFYLNDFQCLKKTLNLLINSLKADSSNYEDALYQNIEWFDTTELHILSTLKYYLWSQEYDKLQEILQNYKLSLEDQIYLFHYGEKCPEKIKFHHVFKKIFSQDYQLIISANKDILLSQTDLDITSNKNLFKSICYINRHSDIIPFQALSNDHQDIAEMLPIYIQNQQAKKTTYLLLISALLNLSKRQLSINSLSEIAKKAKQELSITQKVNQFVQEYAIQIAEVSLFLFKECLKRQLKGFFLDIFVNTSNNIAIFRLITYEQAQEIFKFIISIQNTLIDKTKSLLAFSSLFKFLQYQSDDIREWLLCARKISQISQQFMTKKIFFDDGQNSQYCKAIKLILYNLTNKAGYGFQITDKLLEKNIGIDFHLVYYFSFPDYNEQPLISLIRWYISFKESKQHSKFQIFHFHLLKQQLKRSQIHPQLMEYIGRHSELRLIKKPNHWKMLAKMKVACANFSSKSDISQIIQYYFQDSNGFPYTFNLMISMLQKIIYQQPHNSNQTVFTQKQRILAKIKQWNQIQSENLIFSLPLDLSGKLHSFCEGLFHRHRQRIINDNTSIIKKEQVIQFKQLYHAQFKQILQKHQLQEKIYQILILNFRLIFMLIFCKKHEKGIQLLRKLFKLIRSTNKNHRISSIYNTLQQISTFNIGEYSIYGEKYILIKDIYLQNYKQSHKYLFFDSSQNIYNLLHIFSRFHPEYLVKFTKQIFSYLRMKKGSSCNYIIEAYMKLFRVYLNKKDSEQSLQIYPHQIHRIIYDQITVKQNPYHILVLSFTYFYGKYGNFQQLYYDYYKAFNGIPIVMKTHILSYINYFYIFRYSDQLRKRKLRYLIKLNIVWGLFKLSAKNIYNRLVDKSIREKLKSSVNNHKNHMIFRKITKKHEILQI